MKSLEKSMLFIPNRLYVQGKQLFVSFNIAVIPADMQVTSMTLFVPLPERAGQVRVHLHEIASAWDEESIRSELPRYAPALNVITLTSKAEEGRFAVAHLAAPWRFESLNNHGIYVRLEGSEPLVFTEENPPYLLADTV